MIASLTGSDRHGEGVFPVVSTVVNLEDRLYEWFWKPQPCSRILRAQDNQ